MTEISNNPSASRPAGSAQQQGPKRSVADINRMSGMASGINSQQIIQSLEQVERRRMQPVQDRKAESQLELEAYNLIKKSLEEIQGTARPLGGSAIWEGKIVESSNGEVVAAVATSGAKPGKHTLVVDRLALNHQLASQGFETPESIVGTGRFKVTVGEEAPVTVVIDESNNTLEGLKSAINFATDVVDATIIKTGNKLKPYQLVLTSSKTGSEGRIELDFSLNGGEPPSFENSFEQPSEWAGVGKPLDPARQPATGTGASTAIIRAIGEYAGAEDATYTFTAVQTGTVGGESQLQLRWKSDTGRSGNLELDSFHYAPGEPIELDQGISLLVSQGEIIVGDQFSLNARAGKSDLFWYLSPEDRAAAVSQPSPWGRQDKFGTPKVEGPYTGEDDEEFELRVIGSGQVGSAQTLSIEWKRLSDGESGLLNVGQGYVAGSKMALIDGLTLALQPGVLRDGQTATFETVAAPDFGGEWWRSEEEASSPSQILNVTNFTAVEEVKEAGFQPDFPEELGPRISSTAVEITGKFESDEAKVYTFTALRDGAIGTTKDLRARWEDDKGNSGELNLGEDYVIGTPLPFDSGLLAAFGPGRVFENDVFTVRTRTASVQPPQDASIRLGATELGGGLEITSPTNELDNVIDGVKLNLIASSDRPVTITIKGDTEKAAEAILKFGEQFNTLAAMIRELTKYDQDKNIAGPLLGDRELADIQNRLADLLVDPVGGLPRERNMLFTLGLKLNDQGLLDVDEGTLRNKIEDDFGAVADLFRSKGESENTALAVVGLTEETPASASGLPVNITQVATQGSYTSAVLVEPIVIDETNNQLQITVDGTATAELTLPPGQYTAAEYAHVLQNRITDDETVGKRSVRVFLDEGRLRVVSGRQGGQSAIAFGTVGERLTAGVGLLQGQAEPGRDVAGTIAGEAAEGVGQLLKGAEDAEEGRGLRLLVTLRENQLAPGGPETVVRITKGVASRVAAYLDRLMDARTGQIKRITDNLNTRIRDMDDQLERLEDQVDRKRTRLQSRFARLETQMQSLRSQQGFLSSQLSGLPRGGGGKPGLPGL